MDKFIRSYSLCAQGKSSNGRHGLCLPLPIPTRRWESISMDILSGMLTSHNNHDVIWVVVCRFSKMALFSPCHKTSSAAQTTHLYFRHVWPHFGLPSSIISDRDSVFLIPFWCTLWSSSGFQRRFSTAFHPRTDGKTEVVNSTMVHSLRSYSAKKTMGFLSEYYPTYLQPSYPLFHRFLIIQCVSWFSSPGTLRDASAYHSVRLCTSPIGTTRNTSFPSEYNSTP